MQNRQLDAIQSALLSISNITSRNLNPDAESQDETWMEAIFKARTSLNEAQSNDIKMITMLDPEELPNEVSVLRDEVQKIKEALSSLVDDHHDYYFLSRSFHQPNQALAGIGRKNSTPLTIETIKIFIIDFISISLATKCEIEDINDLTALNEKLLLLGFETKNFVMEILQAQDKTLFDDFKVTYTPSPWERIQDEGKIYYAELVIKDNYDIDLMVTIEIPNVFDSVNISRPIYSQFAKIPNYLQLTFPGPQINSVESDAESEFSSDESNYQPPGSSGSDASLESVALIPLISPNPNMEPELETMDQDVDLFSEENVTPPFVEQSDFLFSLIPRAKGIADSMAISEVIKYLISQNVISNEDESNPFFDTLHANLLSYHVYVKKLVTLKIYLDDLFDLSEDEFSNLLNQDVINLLDDDLCTFSDAKTIEDHEAKIALTYAFLLRNKQCHIWDILGISKDTARIMAIPLITNLVSIGNLSFETAKIIPFHFKPLFENAHYSNFLRYEKNMNWESLILLSPEDIQFLLQPQILALAHERVFKLEETPLIEVETRKTMERPKFHELLRLKKITISHLQDLSVKTIRYFENHPYLHIWLKSNLFNFAGFIELQPIDIEVDISFHSQIYALRLFFLFQKKIKQLGNNNDDIYSLYEEIKKYVVSSENNLTLFIELTMKEFFSFLIKHISAWTENNSLNPHEKEFFLDLYNKIYQLVDLDILWTELLAQLIQITHELNFESKDFSTNANNRLQATLFGTYNSSQGLKFHRHLLDFQKMVTDIFPTKLGDKVEKKTRLGMK